MLPVRVSFLYAAAAWRSLLAKDRAPRSAINLARDTNLFAGLLDLRVCVKTSFFSLCALVKSNRLNFKNSVSSK